MEVLYLEAGGTRYGFTVYEAGTVFNSVSGVYVLLASPDPFEGGDGYFGEGGGRGYGILYIGIASNLKRRFYNHPTFLLAKEQGMSHVGILKVSSGRKRRLIEKSLVGVLKPPMNRYLKE